MKENKKFIKNGQVFQARKFVCDTVIAINLASNEIVRFSICELYNAKWLM